MKKVINVKINGEEVMVKYSMTISAPRNASFSVETTLSELPRFVFFVKEGNAGYSQDKPEHNQIKVDIMRAIDANESK